MSKNDWRLLGVVTSLCGIITATILSALAGPRYLPPLIIVQCLFWRATYKLTIAISERQP